MVATQIKARGIADPRVLDAMRTVPREAFVDPDRAADAYADRPLAIAAGQTISQPYIVGLMAEAADIGPGDRVLEIGAGSGYAAAVIGRLAAQVWAVERIAELADAARERLARLDHDNVHIIHDDGSQGYPAAAPFDAIIAAAAGPAVPDALLDQLAPGGRLVMPVGERGKAQRLVRVRRTEGEFVREDLGAVAFVPLIGAGGFAEEGAARSAASPAHYGSAVLRHRYGSCEDAAVAQCRAILQRGLDGDPDGWLDAVQNARLVSAAERYYRIMYQGGAASWNLRDRHMFETLDQTLQARGPGSRAVVWAHNSHIGDARQTAMGRLMGELNLGQLCREQFGRDAALIGFGTHSGTVAAASDWGGEMQVMDVRPALSGSWEALCHDAGIPRFVADFSAPQSGSLPDTLLERFIGVIYRPDTERSSHYMSATLPRQFDAWVWFDRTTAVTPMDGAEHADRDAAPAPEDADTFPTGL